MKHALLIATLTGLLCGTELASAADKPAKKAPVAKPAAPCPDPAKPASPCPAPVSPPAKGAKDPPGATPAMPCPATRPAGSDEIPRFGTDSPFGGDYKGPTQRREKRLWAKSCLWQPAPDFVVEKWLTKKPEMKGKYVLIEFWATWCPPCRHSIELLNGFHRKYGKDMVIIGVSDQTEAAVRKLKKPKIEYYSAIDTKARMKNALGVFGIPHVIILEPSERVVIWEGFPYWQGYELTEKVIKKIVSIKPLPPVEKNKAPGPKAQDKAPAPAKAKGR